MYKRQVYTLSTGFDLSTATFNDINGDGSGFDVSGQDEATRGFAFNNDGTIMYYIGNTDNEIFVYTFISSPLLPETNILVPSLLNLIY